MPIAARKKLSYADFIRFPDDENRHEILNGEWFQTPPPYTDHAIVISNVMHILSLQHSLGEVLPGPIGVRLSRNDIVQPDILFLSKARLGICKKAYIDGAPDLVVEVLSPATAMIDCGRKLSLYKKAGVPEYWIVDVPARAVEVHHFTHPLKTAVHQGGQEFAVKAMPGLKVRVAEVFAGLRQPGA